MKDESKTSENLRKGLFIYDFSELDGEVWGKGGQKQFVQKSFVGLGGIPYATLGWVRRYGKGDYGKLRQNLSSCKTCRNIGDAGTKLAGTDYFIYCCGGFI